MRKILYITAVLSTLAFFAAPLKAQVRIPPEKPGGKPTYLLEKRVINGETIPHISIRPVFIFPKKADTRQYAKLIRNIKATYPIARYANRKLAEIEDSIGKIPSRREQERYVKQVEKELKAEYAPVLKKMSFSQGKMLIKLIDRETGNTSYQLVKELRGGFSAFLWQGVAKIFGANLKDTYDKDGEDATIEHLIRLYEAGQL